MNIIFGTSNWISNEESLKDQFKYLNFRVLRNINLNNSLAYIVLSTNSANVYLSFMRVRLNVAFYDNKSINYLRVLENVINFCS